MPLTKEETGCFNLVKESIEIAIVQIGKATGLCLQIRSWMNGSNTLVWVVRDARRQVAMPHPILDSLRVVVELDKHGNEIDLADFAASKALFRLLEQQIMATTIREVEAEGMREDDQPDGLKPIIRRRPGCPQPDSRNAICPACGNRHQPRI